MNAEFYPLSTIYHPGSKHVVLIRAALVMVAVITSIGSLQAAAAVAWRPAERPTRSEWCCRHIKLPAETGAQPGSFDLSDHAYLREPLDAVDDHDVREIVFPGGTQIGKSTLLHAIALSQGEVDRAPMLFGGPDQLYAREQRRLVYRIADESPALRRRVPPERRRNDQWIDLEKCLVYLAWSGSRQRLSGRSCKIVLCSEVDGWKEVVAGGTPENTKNQRRQSSIHLATQRTKAFWRSCVIYEGTPVGASPTLWPLYKQSDRRTFRVPCPVCGAFQELRFFPHKSGPHKNRGGVAGLKDDRGNWKTPDEARRAAHYICEHGCRIENDQKAAMIRRGVWCPEGCHVTAEGKLAGRPLRPGRRRGYHINSLYSNTISFGDAAEEYLKVRDTTEGLQSFFNDWLGMPFQPRGRTPKWKDLGIRLAGPVPRGLIPRQAYFQLAGCDVQADGVYWILRAFGDHKTSWLVDFGFLAKDFRAGLENAAGGEEAAEERLASDLAKIDDAILGRRWPVDGQNPRGYSALTAARVAIDRGYRAADVDAFLDAHPGDRVLAVFGDPKISPGALYRPMKTSRNVRSGKLEKDAIVPRCWGIETNAYKSEIADRWYADRTQPGVWWLPSDILTTDGGEDYLRQITAEKADFKRGVRCWDLISHGLDNHYWDGEVYASAIADMTIGRNWDAATWPDDRRPARPPRPEQGAEREDWSAR